MVCSGGRAATSRVVSGAHSLAREIRRPRSGPQRTKLMWEDVAVMATIGLIGAGHIGGQIARLAVANGYNVVISNSRGPETLSGLVAELET